MKMRSLFIVGGLLAIVSGFALFALAHGVGHAGIVLAPISFLVVALGIVSIVVGIATNKKGRA
jgi:hypothetical protein